MKVLLFIDCLGSGGAQRQLVNLGLKLQSKGYDVQFAIYYNRMFYSKYLEESGIEIHKFFNLSYLNRIKKIKFLIDEFKPDVLIAFLEGPAAIASLCKICCKHKFNLIVGERSSNPNILSSCRLRGYRVLHLLVDHIVANSYANLALINKAVPFLNKKKQHVIYNMIDHCYWKPEDSEKVFINKKFKIVVAASHQYLKNCKNMILAVSRLDNRFVDKLEIVWFGNEREDNSYVESKELVLKYNLSNTIFFKEATMNIKEEMLNANCIGLFSYYEGLPNVVCEAMSLEKPVICSDISDISLLLEDKNCIFDPTNVDSIMKSLMYILELNEDELRILGRSNLKKSIDLFNEGYVVSSYESLFVL